MNTTKMTIWMLAAALVGGMAVEGHAQKENAGVCGTGELEAMMSREAEARARIAALREERERESAAVKEAAAKREKKGLVLHYAFGKGGEWGTGRVVKDLSGEGHDGKVEGDGLEVVRGMGKRGKAARFDGKGDYIRVPRDAALEPEEVTVAAWMRVREEDRSAGEDGIGVLVFKRNSSFHDNEDYCFEIRPNHMPQGEIANSRGMHSRVPAGLAMAPDLWHHVVLTVGGGEIKIYLDGKQAVVKNHPYPQDHNTEADLFVGTRDHAQYPLGHFGAFDLAELKIWDEALDGERVAALYRERAGHLGVAKPEDNRAPVVETTVVLPPKRTPPRVFPPWELGMGGSATGLAAELRKLVAQGRRDRAASPEFLGALEGLLEQYRRTGGASVEKPSDKLPLKAFFWERGMPSGWKAVKPEVWRFGDGEARQVESKANTRYVLYYEPGVEWTDYEATFRFESDAWFQPPAKSSAVLYFRYHDIDDSYSVWMDGAGDLSLISLDKERHGAQRYLAWVPVDRAIILDGKPWTVKVLGDKIEIWHEGKKMLFATDSAHPSGTVGLESVHIPMRFSGVEVR